MSGTFVGMPSFPQSAKEAVHNKTLRGNLRHATHTIRDKRAKAVAELADWAELREAGKQIKDHTLRHLDRYLVQLETRVTEAGGTVHWAADADEANRIVADLVKATGESEVVKVKSMATQEIGLNEALEAEGIAAYETDLAELIVQLGDDRPSHILVPAIHRNRGEIRDIFRAKMADWGAPRPTGSPTSRRTSPRPRGSTSVRSSCAPRSASPAPTSWSPRPAHSSSSSPRATGGCV